MVHCFVHTGSKLIIVDSERADVILPALIELQAGGVTGFMVFAKPSPLRKWCGMQIWSEVMSSCGQDSSRILPEDPKSLPEDNAAVIFTSGTYVDSAIIHGHSIINT